MRDAIRGDEPLVDHSLKILPPERVRLVERGATDEERRCQALLPERRQRVANVARQVVVEGDRHGETPAAAASTRRSQELAGRDDAVVAAKMAQLPLADLA